ncbi:hypothetical protein [Sediminitomix flava]|uniref:Uncharacterized protein n=1 Tax=Sediminitomix flava TaxID=379075 RepID=A0A315ZFV7_SEDFL|nr:hypothetical protein [Sediminitomix flava]PWJ44020.1 hypothetical protein BC781_101370 [Sediminitomix flava]
MSHQESTNQIVKKIESSISKGKSKKITLGDVVSFTGNNTDEAKYALDKMLEKYHCQLQVTDEGGLIYNFGDALRLRNSKTLKEKWEDVKGYLWEFFVLFFKVWIALMLVVYFVIFLALLVASIVLQFSGSSDDDDRGSSGQGVSISPTMMFFMTDLLRGFNLMTMFRGERYRYEQTHREHKVKNKKSFLQSVYDFVFGPPSAPKDPLLQHKKMANFIRENKGVAIETEATALTGFTGERAADFYSDVIVRFGGEPQIHDKGVLFAKFEELKLSSSQAYDEAYQWFWDQSSKIPNLTGNSSSTNTWIVGINLFNLLASVYILNASYDPELYQAIGEQVNTVRVFLGWIPMAFSFVFFAVPGLRYWSMKKKKHKEQKDAVRKELFQIIFTESDAVIERSYLIKNAEIAGEDLSESFIEDVVEEVALDLEADVNVDQEGRTVYDFSILKDKVKIVESIRQQEAL